LRAASEEEDMPFLELPQLDKRARAQSAKDNFFNIITNLLKNFYLYKLRIEHFIIIGQSLQVKNSNTYNLND
jgi:hypothetical protein